MPWFLPWSESIKKRACRYLLQRYLGQFFEEKLTLDQLSVNLYNGTGTVADVSLDVQALNELGEQQNWPMEFVDGYIEQMSISVPWSALLKDSSNIEVRGLNITIQPKQRSENATSMFESMWSSMTSSMQLAQECLKQELPNAADNAQPLEGIERFAQTIDSILSRVKVRFINTIIRLEHVPKDCTSGVAMQISIKNLEYLDEAGDDPSTSETAELTSQDENKAYVISSFTLKKFLLEGVTFSSEEFPSRSRTFSRSMMNQSQTSVSNLEQSKGEDVFLSTIIEDSIKRNSDSTRESSMENTPLNEVPTSSALDTTAHEPILFGKLSGRQEIRVRLKQSEAISGPKISMEMTFGSLMLFLSPRQLHVLIELAEGIASPHLEDTSNVPNKSRCQEKPMGGLDFQRIEQELQQHLNPIPPLSTGLQHTKGWSTASFDDEDDNDLDFLPMRNQMMSDSVLSSTNSMDSSISTSVSSVSSRSTPHRAHRRNTTDKLDLDPTAEITHFQIRLASLAIVLLHEDLLTISTNGDSTLVPTSVAHMKHTAEMFFDKLGPFGITGYGNKDFENARDTFEKACQLNHIRLLCAPIQIEGDQKSTLTAHALSLAITAAKLELLECLWNNVQEPVEYVKLISELEETQTKPIGSQPFFRLEYKHVEKIMKHSHQKVAYPNKTDITIRLNKCVTEVDITIIDRISAVLNPQPVCNNKASPRNETVGPFTQAAQPEANTSEYKVDLKVTCPVFIIKLRFPIPDFRQPHDMQRTPWWKRNVRPDFLTLQMIDSNLMSSMNSTQTCYRYEIQCRLADLHYTEESKLGAPLHIGRISIDDKCQSLPDGFNWPRVVIEVYPLQRNPGNLDDTNLGMDDPMSMPHSMEGFGEMKDDLSKNPSPFSSKRVVHESDTPHVKNQPDNPVTEELIIPGDRVEMSNFIEHATRTSQIQLDLFIPTLSLQLVSKHIYELLYNRINSDLLLWEPSAPRPQSNIINTPNLGCDLQESIYPMFSMCKSGIQYESESDSDDGSCEGDNDGVFYSFCESKVKPKPLDINTCYGQSFLSLNVHILQGILCMNPPVRDTALNVIPEQQGELLLIAEDASIFVVSQYMGDPNLSYVCVQSVSASLHHCDITSTPSQSAPLKEFGYTVPRYLYTTIHKSEPGVAVQANGVDRCGQRDMLSVAVRVQASHETHHVKTIRVAVGVRLATLRHRMCAEPNSWFTQMIDFFDVFDYPIPGYNPMAVLTEFHLHLWDCAIDYRPYYLPLRSLLSLGNFSMSSHLAAQVNTSTLRFIAEECYLFLSDRAPPKGNLPSIAPVDLRRDYVCVVELSLFELSLRLSDRQRGVPHVDLRASNNIVHIRTCSDTARALMQLITYFATDGDLTQKEKSSTSSEQSTPRKTAPQEQLLNVEPQEISGLSTSQHQQVNELLGEAMKESLVAPPQLERPPPIEGDTGTDVFFFPDESRPCAEIVPVLTQLNLERRNSYKSTDTDEEFCIVGDEAGLGIMPKSGLPEIRWLTDEPVRIVENHFTVPVGKTDLLKPPKHFPGAVLRYTLCEMTLIWHIYGGYDFQSTVNEKDTPKKTVNFEDKTQIRGSEVCFSKSDTNRVVFMNKTEPKEKPKYGWRTKGGAKRDHDVLMELQLNKVRFQHEVYPDDTTQASRQVLLISEVEVRDRLASSHFNKFLYQHTTQARPKQSHANMIVIKAIHIRPDPKLTAQECILRVSLLPLRLNVDQDSLLFLVKFFNELGGQDVDNTSTDESSRHTTPTHQPPVMTVTVDNPEEAKQQAQKLVSDNLLILLEEDEEGSLDGDSLDSKKLKTIPQIGDETPPPIYFRNVLFSPEVPIRLDYQGKHVDMTHGPLAGLLMGLGQLNCSELRLKRLSHRHGLLGVDKLLSYALHEWLQDIKRHQLPSLLGGFGPMHSFVQLFQGIRDLFWLPIEQYQKDGRLVRGLQRGANSFTTSTAMAALELTSRIIHLIQATAETAYDMVSPGPSVKRRSTKGKKGKRRHYSQPQDIREGMANAIMVVKEGIGETAGTIVRVASQEHEQKGYSGAVGGVLRQIPPTFVKPIIIASEATNNVLGGMRSQLVPDARREANQKWRSEDG